MNTSLGSSITIPVQLKGTGGGEQNPAGSDEPETAGEEKGNYKGKLKKLYPQKINQRSK
jgi:hypothetical protein